MQHESSLRSKGRVKEYSKKYDNRDADDFGID